MAEPHFSPESEADLEDIADFIAQDNPARAVTFVEELRAKCQLLAENPRAGPSADHLRPGLRSFPHGAYLILYQPAPDGVDIVHIVHGARDLLRLFGDLP